MTTTYVLVNLVNTFDDDFAALTIDRQHGAPTARVVSSYDFNGVTFANVHLHQLRKHSILGRKRQISIPCNRQ